MEECGSATAKYIIYYNIQCSVYRFIGSIIDHSNWSGPFSLVVMTPDFYPGERGSRPALAGCFYLHVYISHHTTHATKHNVIQKSEG